MKKIYLLFVLLILIIPTLVGCNSKNTTIESFVSNNINITSRIVDNRFQVYNNGAWKDIIVKGVNIGDALPGGARFEINQKDYFRWFEKIGEMNANTIRIHEIFPPEFYEALEQYNKKNTKPLYLFQGVNIDNYTLLEQPDTFKLDNIVPFKEEIENAIHVIHGKGNIANRDYLANGKYKSDISPYVLGFILGMEWQPELVDNVNKTRIDKGEFTGKYIYTEEAKPFEHWLADVMDYTLAYEFEEYGWHHPISFINWTNTDLLKHSFEPVKEVDMVSINPNVIKLKDNSIGQFASYNIYPYYPEFLNLDPKYSMYIDHRGKTNSFAGYLKDLISVHNMPVLVSEFGLPSSRVMEKVSVHGLNKGLLSEKQQGEYIASMFEDIIVQDSLGGIINNWQDNWNVWSNSHDANQQFGLLSFDRNKIIVDGNIKDWKSNKSEALFVGDKRDKKLIKNVYMDHDERYLYFAIEYNDLKTTSLDTLILLDTISNQGNHTNPFNGNITAKTGMDFVISIKDKGVSKVLVDSYYDSHYFQYNKYLANKNPEFQNKGNELFNPIRSILRKEITSFKTGQKIPFMDYEIGVLKQGNGNPESLEYNSLSDYYINKDKGILELRIPWALIGFTDPSKKQIQGDLYVGGLDNKNNIDNIKVSISAYPEDDGENYFTLPEFSYHWDNWDKPIIEERLKQSYYILKEKFSDY